MTNDYGAQFFDYPVYNAALESERNIINLSQIQSIKPHANVPVDPGAVDTACVEFFYKFGTSDIILLDYDTVKSGMKGFFGLVDADGILS